MKFMKLKHGHFDILLADIKITDDMKLPYQEHFNRFISNDDELNDLQVYFYWLGLSCKLYRKSKNKTSFEDYLKKMTLAQSLEEKLQAFRNKK